MPAFDADEFGRTIKRIVMSERAPGWFRKIVALLGRCFAQGLILTERLEAALQVRGAWPIAVGGLLALQIALIVTHSPWFDEWQAVLIALQSPTLDALFANLRYEGHPPLWYLILRSLGTWVSPRAALALAVMGPALVAQSCILFASPFRRGDRLLLATSCFFLFELFTISRSASLGGAVLILVATLWRTRWSWLAIAALPFCDFLFGVISGILVLLRIPERRLWWPGVALWLGSAGAAAWTVRPAPDIATAIPPQNPFVETGDFVNGLGLLLVPLQTNGLWPMWDGISFLGSGGLAGLGFLYFCLRETEGYRLHRWLVFGFIAFAWVFSMVIYHLPVRHLMLIAILLILLAWLKARQGHALSPAMRVWLLVGSICGLLVAAINLVVPFDNSARIASAIESRGLEKKLWLAFPDAAGMGVGTYAMTGMTFARPERHCLQGFIHWNYPANLKTEDSFARYLRGQVAERGKFYLLTHEDLTGFPADLIQPLAEIPAGYNGRKGLLYVVGPGRPDAASDLPPCVPNLRPLAAVRERP